jgi:hypothetical protein
MEFRKIVQEQSVLERGVYWLLRRISRPPEDRCSLKPDSMPSVLKAEKNDICSICECDSVVEVLDYQARTALTYDTGLLTNELKMRYVCTH